MALREDLTPESYRLAASLGFVAKSNKHDLGRELPNGEPHQYEGKNAVKIPTFSVCYQKELSGEDDKYFLEVWNCSKGWAWAYQGMTSYHSPRYFSTLREALTYNEESS